MISVSLAASQTPVYTARPRIRTALVLSRGVPARTYCCSVQFVQQSVQCSWAGISRQFASVTVFVLSLDVTELNWDFSSGASFTKLREMNISNSFTILSYLFRMSYKKLPNELQKNSERNAKESRCLQISVCKPKWCICEFRIQK